MFATSTDRDWQMFADRDPYWAVLTAERFRGSDPGPDALDEFYRTGEQYVSWLFNTVRAHVDAEFDPWAALDFGCGVGRLTLPLARQCGRAVGVDVADAMLVRASARAKDDGLVNVQFVRGDDDLSGVTGRFDLVHSFIVLQHIPPARGMRILRRLLALIAPNGVGALHVTYGEPARSSFSGRARATAAGLFDRVRPLLRGLVAPKMQMNRYDLNIVFRMLHEAGARQITSVLTDHGGCRGTLLLFRRESQPVCEV